MSTQPSIFAPKLQELGRIRIGDQVATKGGNTRPNRLQAFRLTSTNKPLLHAAAAQYGGDVTEWENAPTDRQWQLYTETNALSVTVPPFATISQCFERWSGGGCQLRCNGETISHGVSPEQIGAPCVCPQDPSERQTLAAKGEACAPVTRLSLLMPSLPGIGVWRLDTRGFYAGSELAGIVPFLQAASAEGRYLACVLQLETRQVKRNNGTLIFPVVTLQPAEATLVQLLTQQLPDSALIAPPQVPHQRQIESALTEEISFEDAVENLYGERPGETAEAVVETEAIVETAEAPDPNGAPTTESVATSEVVTVAQETPKAAAEDLGSKDYMLRLRANLVKVCESRNMKLGQVKALVAECGGKEGISLRQVTDIEVLRKIEDKVVANVPATAPNNTQGDLLAT